MNDLFPLAIWYLIILLVGFLSFPITYTVLPEFSDRGYSLARVVGLLLCGYGFWILATFGFLSNDFGGALIGVVILLIIDSFLLKKEGIQPVFSWLKRNWKTWVFSEAVFLLAFIFMFFLRVSDPIISGTEKPMELAFINAILESPAFPPADPWLSGYSISYYYFGYVMVAVLARLSNVTGGVAFNLAIITWFALTAQAAFGLLFTLLARWMVSRGSAINPPGSILKMRKWAFLGAFFILIVSNWGGLLEVLHSRALFWERDNQGQLQSDFWTWLGVKELDQPPSEPFTGEPERNGGIWWWRASRVIQDSDMQGNNKEIIDEFPFFSYYLADLHPHVLSMPFILLALSISANFFFSAYSVPMQSGFIIHWVKEMTAGGNYETRTRGIWNTFVKMDFWFASWIFGALAFINIWDFPVYVGLFSGVYLLKRTQQDGWHSRNLLEFFELVLILGLAGVLFYLPYYAGFSSQAGGILPSMSFFTRGVHFWLMFAPLLVSITAWLIWSSWKYLNRYYLLAGIKISVFLVGGFWLLSYLLGGLFASGNEIVNLLTSLFGAKAGAGVSGKLIELSQLFSSLHGTTDDKFLLLGSLVRRLLQPGTWLTMLLIIGLCLGLILRSISRHEERNVQEPVDGIEMRAELDFPPPHQFALLLILIGAGLTVIPEFFYLRDQFGWRMNTIFKFYFQTWIVWGIAAAYAFSVLCQEAKKITGIMLRAGLILSVGAGLLYPAFAISNRLRGFEWENMTIDGTKHISDYNRAEYDAILWLKNAPYGIVSEAVGGSYSGYGRIATNSGYPTVLGWPGHESQWRGGSEEMGSREQDIETLYRTSDWKTARSVLEKYGVRYVYLGDLERSTYRASEKKFLANLRIAFQEDDVTIFEVPGY